MKKGIIAIIVIVVLVVIGYLVWGGKSSSVTNTNEQASTSTPAVNVPAGVTKDTYAPESTDTSLLGRLKSASVAASETGNKVALVNGKASVTENGVKSTITLGDVAIEKTVGSDKFALANVAVNNGGSGTFQYIVLFQDKNGSLSDNSYALIGDRVKITGIRGDIVVQDGTPELVVSVSYLDRPQTDPMSAAPSIPRTTILVVENGAFNPAKTISL